MRLRARMRVLAAVLAGCGSGPAGAPAGGSEGGEPATGETSEGSAESGSSGETGTGSGSGELACPADDEGGWVDGLVRLGRAEGDTFIEIVDVITRDGIVYACTGTQGLTIWDGADDPNPDLLAENVGPAGLVDPMYPRCQHVALDPGSSRAAIGSRGDELQPTPWVQLYDLSDPAQPVALGGWSGDASIEGLALAGDRIYVAAHTAGVLVFEDQGGDTLVQVGAFADADSDAWQPVLAGSTLYVAEGQAGLRIYDVAGDDPELRHTVPLAGSSNDLVLDGDTLWVAASQAIHGIDVGSPAPEVLVEREVSGTAVAMTMGAEGVLFVAEWDEIRGYDTRAADLPLQWSEVVPTDGDVSRVLAVGADAEAHRLYAGEWTGLHAYRQEADPIAPEIAAAPASLQFGEVAVGDSSSKAFVVRNTGAGHLKVFATEGWTSMRTDPSCFEVEPGGAVAVEAFFEPKNADEQHGFLVLQTNDPDEPEYRVRVAGNIDGVDVGEPAIDFSLVDLDGQTWTLSELRGQVVVLAYFATF